MQNTIMPERVSGKMGHAVLRAVMDLRDRDPDAFQRDREKFAQDCYGMSWEASQMLPPEEAQEIVHRWMVRELSAGKKAELSGIACSPGR